MYFFASAGLFAKSRFPLFRGALYSEVWILKADVRDRLGAARTSSLGRASAEKSRPRVGEVRARAPFVQAKSKAVSDPRSI